jgi:2-(1,2-epoxy-1,2-dihydrophenyl)acetyl-CoA isomerase
MSPSRFVDLAFEGRTATLTLDRPTARNALNLQMKEELVSALEVVFDSAGCSVLILRAAGADFCVGSDLRDMTSATGMEYRRTIERLQAAITMQMWRSEIAIIGVVEGYAAGGGFSLVLPCDLVVVSETAKFKSAFIHRAGLAPDLGLAYLLPRTIGISRAKDILLTGRTIPAHEAIELGIAQRLAPSATIGDAVAEVVDDLLAASPLALRAAKMLVNRPYEAELAAYLHHEAAIQAILRGGADHAEAVASLRERRPPAFSGEPRIVM